MQATITNITHDDSGSTLVHAVVTDDQGLRLGSVCLLRTDDPADDTPRTLVTWGDLSMWADDEMAALVEAEFVSSRDIVYAVDFALTKSGLG